MRSIYRGKAEAVLPQFPDACFDALICDPPAGISFLGEDWDCFRRTHNPNDVGRNNVFGRISRTSPHSYGESDRERFIACMTIILAEALRTLRAGGYGCVWSLPRTSHWTAMALEDAGWEIRDCITYHHGQGFPKGPDVLKPATEFWWLVRKPLSASTVERQMQETGTGRLNVDSCRIEAHDSQLAEKFASVRNAPPRDNHVYGQDSRPRSEGKLEPHAQGRWPANLVLAHAAGCVQVAVTPTEDRRRVSGGKGFSTGKYGGSIGIGEGTIVAGVRDYGDGKDAPAWQCSPDCPVSILNAQSGGGVGKYFTVLPYEEPFIYLPKASPKDRTMNGMVENGHKTVKSTALMAWLCTLITPPGGTILDCFMGSGSTLIAASRLGFSWVGIDESPEYCEIARARLATLGVEVEVNAQDAPAPIAPAPIAPAPVAPAPVQSRIRYHVGSIFEVDAQVLVNPVNCQGILGKGLARQFKERFPEMAATYREDCRTKKLALGHPRLYKGSTPWILNLPTKDTWTAPSRLEYIERSLQYVATHYQQAGITSMVFPKLGCSEGGLSWDDVGPLMATYLSAMNADVTICVSEHDTQYQERHRA